MDVGVVKVAEDSDFEELKSLIDNHTGWKLDYSKEKTNVWTKSASNTDFKMVKISTVFEDVSPLQMYDVLHDPEYRKVWDVHMIDAHDIGYLNPNNDVGYYSMSCPAPLKNRDFVLQRSWLDTGEEQLIVNHSVCHRDYPPKSNYVRAISHITGFLIRPNGNSGCFLGYLSQTDPKGTLPPWLVNKVTQIFAPKTVKNLHKASQGYETWKAEHNPNLKPWYHPEQLTAPRITVEDCVALVDVIPSLQDGLPTPGSPKSVTKKEKKLLSMSKVLRKH